MAKTTDSSYKKIKSIKKGKEDKVGVVELAPEAVEQPTTETPTTTPVATTPVATDPAQAAVDSQAARDRIWDSLSYSYDRKRQKSDEAYDKAFSQQDRHALSRGMQRSSYNAQVLANLQNQKIEAANDIESEKIADYENRLTELERQEKADEQWMMQYKEGVRQHDEQMALSREQLQTSREQFEKEFDLKQQSSDRQYDYQLALGMIQQGKMPSKALLQSAGISRKDAKKMIGDKGITGGTSGTPKPTNPTNPTDPTKKPLDISGLNTDSQTGGSTIISGIGSRVNDQVNKDKKKLDRVR